MQRQTFQNPSYQTKQYTGAPNGQPVQPSNGGAWDFLNSGDPQPPKKESIFKRYKMLIIIAGSSIFLLLLVAILAAASSTGSKTANNDDYIAGPTTSVSTNTYDSEYFSMVYAQALKINIDESVVAPPGWFVQFAEEVEPSPYDIKIQIGNEPSIYESGEEAVSELLEPGVEPTNVVSSDITVAGVAAKKTVGEYTGTQGEERYVVYTTAQVGSEYVIVSGTYPKANQEITDSFDAMVGSIKLKNSN